MLKPVGTPTPDRRIVVYAAAFTLGCLAATQPLRAQDIEEAERQDQILYGEDHRDQAALKFRELALTEARAARKAPLDKRLTDKIRLSFAYLETFDRNANYDSAHKKDWAQQINFFTTYADTWAERLRYQLKYAMETGLNHHFTKNDSFRNEMQGKIDLKLHDRVVLRSLYDAGYYRFPHATQSSYWRHRVKTSVEHQLFKKAWIRHEPSFTYEYKDYVYRKARVTLAGTTASTVNTPNDRKDSVYRLGHEITLRPVKPFQISTLNEIGFNESNDQHQDFYDYQYFKSSHTASLSIKKWYTFAGVQFQRRNYSARRFDPTSSAEWEDLPSVFGGIFYSMTPELNLGFNATYLKSDSNYPSLEYQGATFTLGLYSNLALSGILNIVRPERPPIHT